MLKNINPNKVTVLGLKPRAYTLGECRSIHLS